MKICFLSGANSVHSRRWVGYFSRRGHKIDWISLGCDLEEPLEGVRFHLIEKKGLRVLRPIYYANRIKKIIRESNPDIFHVHQVWIDGIVAARAGFHPMIITPWGSDVLIGPKSIIKRPLVKYALSKADLVTCDGENTKAALMALGVPENKIETVCFGSNTEKFKPGPKNQDLARRLNVGNGPVIISLRSLKPVYDLQTLIKAAPPVLQQMPGATFIVAGGGEQEKYLKDLSDSLGVSKSVRFVGNITETEMPDYLRLADIYVSTALSDSGLAASTAEAMACGLPVVVTDSGDAGKWIRNGASGFVIPKSDPKALAGKLINILGDRSFSKKLGRNARDIIVEKNDYAVEMEKMEKIYQKISDEHKR